MTATILHGKTIATEIKKSVAAEVNRLKEKYHQDPLCTTILIGHDPASEMYLSLRDKACNTVGITTHLIRFETSVSEQQLLKSISMLNSDEMTHGILIQYPVPKNLSAQTLMNAIHPSKDVEGFHPINLGKTILGDEYLVPCTPLAVLSILDHERIDVKGKNITIINHSTILGKPLAALLLNRNATVSVCHEYTRNLTDYTRNADIIVSGAGVPRLITKDHIKDGVVIIDVGIVKTKDGVCGDIDVQSVKDKASLLTPVPGGVGPITIACALSNMQKTYQNAMQKTKTRIF